LGLGEEINEFVGRASGMGLDRIGEVDDRAIEECADEVYGTSFIAWIGESEIGEGREGN
jgi:hypothetical protein